jgi:hypothetical protein
VGVAQRAAPHLGGEEIAPSVVGEIELAYQAFALPGDAGLNLFVYTAAPDSPAQEALRFLASWADGRTPTGAGGISSRDDDPAGAPSRA